MHNGTQHNVVLLNDRTGDDQLITITEKYPYYSIAQFLLLLRLKTSQDKNLERQACKTALFFPDKKWLNTQLGSYTRIIDNSDKSPKINEVDVDIISVRNSNGHRQVPSGITKSTTDNEEVISFEPLYTVDYFASQGIKISEENVTNDKLGIQLKSFTEWLKSMKKIHAHNLPENDEQTDKIIQHIAESSNTNTNIVTEAMAEVLLKQKKIEQAIDMYEKLSLTYPSKSAYFAAKIQSLKSV